MSPRGKVKRKFLTAIHLLDLLTAVDGQSITYDAIGNPTSYYNGSRYSMSWSEGRRLSSLTAGGNTTTYTYDLNGLRNKKVNSDGTWVKYFIADGKIIGETRYPASGGYLYDMRYTFDENGDVCGISIWNNGDNHWTKYYFLKSLQGDVLAVYEYGDTFTKVAEYTYDSWGNVLTKSGTLADINPFRYRSYYQDPETNFYYLQSRYYDPTIGRFINADNQISSDRFIGTNLFAYCDNNPINRFDPYGNDWKTVFWVGVAIVAVGVAILAAVPTGGSSLAVAGAAFSSATAAAAIGVAATATGLAVSGSALIHAASSNEGKQPSGGKQSSGGKRSTDIGKEGERQAGIDTKEKTKISVNNRNRIPDRLTEDVLTEVKNVLYLANTLQLRDFADYASANNLQLQLIVRTGTTVAKTVIEAGWEIIRLIVFEG